jgi:hypothetical protein
MILIPEQGLQMTAKVRLRLPGRGVLRLKNDDTGVEVPTAVGRGRLPIGVDPPWRYRSRHLR